MNNYQTVQNVTPQKKGGGDKYGHARMILEKMFITPEEISSAGFFYKKSEIELLQQNFLPPDMLLGLRDNKCVIVAGPPEPLSCSAMTTKNCFFRIDDPYCLAQELLKDKVGFGWLILQPPFYMDSHVVGNSEYERKENWEGLKKKLSKFDLIKVASNAAEIAWVLLVYQHLRRKKFFISRYDGVGVIVDEETPSFLKKTRGWGCNINYTQGNKEGIEIGANSGSII